MPNYKIEIEEKLTTTFIVDASNEDDAILGAKNLLLQDVFDIDDATIESVVCEPTKQDPNFKIKKVKDGLNVYDNNSDSDEFWFQIKK